MDTTMEKNTTNAKQVLKGLGQLKDTLMEYVFGYDVAGDGYLRDANITHFHNLDDLFSSASDDAHNKYIEDRYPGARKRYIDLLASDELAALDRIEQQMVALLPHKPVLPDLTPLELVGAATSLGANAADTACITALYAMADAAPTTEGMFRKYRHGRI